MFVESLSTMPISTWAFLSISLNSGKLFFEKCAQLKVNLAGFHTLTLSRKR